MMSRTRSRLVATVSAAGIACLIMCVLRSALGQGPAETLPEGPGLAARYPGDTGIDKDADVVFVEDFERASIGYVTTRWEDVSKPEVLSLSDERPAASGGRHSLLVQHVGGKGTGAHLYRRLPAGHDRLFVRFYVRFDRECVPIHHFFHIGGYNPATPYPQAGPGSARAETSGSASVSSRQARRGSGITTPTGWRWTAARRGASRGVTTSFAPRNPRSCATPGSAWRP